MSSKTQNLDEMLECAIREKGAIAHMVEIDRRERMQRIRRLKFFAYGVAACTAVVIFAGISFGNVARKAGYAYEPASGQKGGSEITALMQENRTDEAMHEIGRARARFEKETIIRKTQDPEYARQLEDDREELDFLDAVCLLRKGRYFRARKALRVIAAGKGAYSSEAESLLEKM